MKKNQDIEKILKNIKTGYNVPDDYFDTIEKKFEVELKKHTKNTIRKKIYSKLMIAASIVFLLGTGYIQLKQHQQKQTKIIDTIEKTSFVKNNTDDYLFDDINDDEIIDFLSEENDLEEILKIN